MKKMIAASLGLTVSMSAQAAECGFDDGRLAFFLCVKDAVEDHGSRLLNLEESMSDFEEVAPFLDLVEDQLEDLWDWVGSLDTRLLALEEASSGDAEASSLACPDGWEPVAGGRLCIDPIPRGPSSMHDANEDCSLDQARVCKESDFLMACGAGVDIPVTVGWMGDHSVASGGNGDDEYLTRNRGCDGFGNIDGPAFSATDVSYEYSCCQ